MREQDTTAQRNSLTFGDGLPPDTRQPFSTLRFSAPAIVDVAPALPVYKRLIADRSPLAG